MRTAYIPLIQTYFAIITMIAGRVSSASFVISETRMKSIGCKRNDYARDFASEHQLYKKHVLQMCSINGDDDSYDTTQINVLGTPLKSCCCNVGDSGVATGYYRNGYCSVFSGTNTHGICAIVDADFLSFSKLVNNDLSTPRPDLKFPGLQPGCKWCVSIDRWIQAYKLGFAPKVILRSCHERVLNYVDLEVLMEYAEDFQEAKDISSRLNSERNELERLLTLTQGVFE